MMRTHRLLRETGIQLLTFLLSLLISSLLIFLALHVLPGDASAILGGTDASPEQIARLRSQMGLDLPWPVQYVTWLGKAAHGDLGVSTLTHVSVAAQLAQKLSVTLPLCIGAIGISTVVGFPLGFTAALWRHRWYGKMIAAMSQLGAAIPAFIIGLSLALTLGVQAQILPSQGFPSDGWLQPDIAMQSLILPSLTLSIPMAASFVRFTRSAALDVLNAEWVRTAQAQGWSLIAVMMRQGVRNASLPLVAVVGLELAELLTGSVLVENVFALPGIGTMLTQGIGSRDMITVQGTLLVLTTAIMALTTLLNIIYRAIDPHLNEDGRL